MTFTYNPVPKPSHNKIKKPKKINHNRNKPRLRDRGRVKPEVYEAAYKRSGGHCERCGWKDGSFDPTGQRWRLEAAHAVRRRHLDETQPEDIIFLCAPQQSHVTCHYWIDHVREGMEWAKQFRTKLLRDKGA